MMLETQTVSRMFGSSNDASLIHTLSGRLMSHEVDAQLLRFYDFQIKIRSRHRFVALAGIAACPITQILPVTRCILSPTKSIRFLP